MLNCLVCGALGMAFGAIAMALLLSLLIAGRSDGD